MTQADESSGTIKAAVIGAGWFGAQNHIPVLAARGDVALDGVCRLGAAELERVRGHFGFPFASEDFRDLLARRPAIAVIATPHHLHYEQARAAIEAGAHVMIEKPMTLDPDEAWDLVARARKADRAIVVANGYHYLPSLADIRDLLRAGAVGPIEHVMASFISATRNVFEGGEGLGRWKTTFFRPDRATWQDSARGGGFAYGQMSHSIALALWLTGLKPQAVNARMFKVDGNDVTDAATLACAGGAVVSLSGAAAMPEGERGLMRLFVTGREGVMEIELDRDRAELRRRDGANRRFAIAEGAWVYRCDGPVNALADIARGGGANHSPGEIGAATVSVIAAMLASAARDGAAVEVAMPPETRL